MINTTHTDIIRCRLLGKFLKQALEDKVLSNPKVYNDFVFRFCGISNPKELEVEDGALIEAVKVEAKKVFDYDFYCKIIQTNSYCANEIAITVPYHSRFPCLKTDKRSQCTLKTCTDFALDIYAEIDNLCLNKNKPTHIVQANQLNAREDCDSTYAYTLQILASRVLFMRIVQNALSRVKKQADKVLDFNHQNSNDVLTGKIGPRILTLDEPTRKEIYNKLKELGIKKNLPKLVEQYRDETEKYLRPLAIKHIVKTIKACNQKINTFNMQYFVDTSGHLDAIRSFRGTNYVGTAGTDSTNNW